MTEASLVNYQIDIGTIQEAEILYAYPNNPSLGWTLEQTIEHWVNQTIKRDAYEGQIKVYVSVFNSANLVAMTLTADQSLQPVLALYAQKLKAIYKAGLKAHNTVIPKLKKDGLWDPRHKNWRFFMPMGLPMVRPEALQFFHYPPQKMLDDLQDYLDDPVPHRVENLLMALGVSDRLAAQEFECIVDGAPIAAPDDAGSAPGSKSPWGYIPINYFTEYQQEMVAALLNDNASYPGYTVPIVVYGKHPNKIFSQIYLGGHDLGVNKPVMAQIVPGKQTPVIGSHHPYGFYWTAQVGVDGGSGEVGDGYMKKPYCARAVKWMIDDLITTSWLLANKADPTQDQQALITKLTAKYNDASEAALVCALTQSQATLEYTNAAKTLFDFRVDVPTAGNECYTHGNVTCSFIA